jgi:signal transduction histidine kinase
VETPAAKQPQTSETAAVASKAAPSQTARKAGRKAAPRGRGGSQRVVDPNRLLKKIDRELHSLAGDPVNLVVKLEAELGRAAAPRVPLAAIVRTLVMNARDAMPGGGELLIETSRLELATGEPGVIPAVAPDQYITIAVTDSGSEPDEDTLSRLFEPPTDETSQSIHSGDRLVLSTVYRILQACGGDLSVEVKPGIGSTFTIYLPRASVETRAPRESPRTPPPMAPSPNVG